MGLRGHLFQACINYIADSYNLSRYNANIIIADGEYEESIVLPSYSTNTGVITIQPTTPGGVTIKRTDATIISGRSGGRFLLHNLKFELTINSIEQGAGGGLHVFLIMSNISLEIFGMHITINMQGDFSNGLRYCNAISAQSYSDITFSAGDIGYSVTINNPNSARVFVMWGSNYGKYMFNGSNVSDVSEESFKWDVNGDLGSGSFMRLSLRSSCVCQTGRTYITTFTGTTSGRRYDIAGGSSCETGNQGEELFPGDAAGYVETATFSWYK